MACFAVTSIWLHSALAAEECTLQEPAGQTRIYSVDSHLKVTGQLETATGGGKAVALKLKVDARLKYRERRLAGTGRDAEAFRSLRSYTYAAADIEVHGQKSYSRLREQQKLIVAQGKREGILRYGLAGPMTHSELELLSMPGDSLALLGLLPRTAAAVGETWLPDSWVVGMLTGTEAVLKGDLTCELASAAHGVATVKFQGEVEGATEGAATTVKLSGHYEYDLKEKYIKRLQLTQTEKRSVGSISPGMDVVAEVVMERKPAANAGPPDDAAVARVGLDPDPSLLWLDYEAPWNVRFFYDRNWHVFHQTKDLTILRLLEKGSLIAQCNVYRISPESPGRHTSEAQFQQDIAKTLGKKLKSIVKAEQVKTADKRFVYRVTAIGKSNGIGMHWIYYLCASPSGRQTTFVFAVESKLLSTLANRDLSIVESLEFLPPHRPPVKASR